jgi:hypothetical protein
MLIKFLIIFFSLLIIYQFSISLSREGLISREGLENGSTGNYQNYNNSPEILTYKNAANIEILQDEYNKCNCSNIYTILTDLSGQIQTIQNQLNSYSHNNVSPTMNPSASSSSSSDSDANNSLALMNNN